MQNINPIKAAVACRPKSDFEIQSLHIEPPQPDEVLIEIAGVGLCHTDLIFRDQFVPYPLPAVLGHEGAGIVRKIGADVRGLAPGDTVIVGFSSCGSCSRCAADLPGYCSDFVPLNYAGSRQDGTTALSLGDAPVASHFFGQSSFASFAVVPQRNVVKIDAEGLDLRILGTLACGFQTGAGSIMRTFDCQAGNTVVIFGGGPVGQAAVMAAAHRACAKIVVVEPVAVRRAVAQEIGATDTLDPGEGNVAERLREILPQGFDFALDTSGREEAMAAGLAVLASHGMLGLVGVPGKADATLQVNLAATITLGHRIVGIIEGDSDLHTFIPELIALHRAGAFPFDRLVSLYPLEQINEAIDAQTRGNCLKAVLIP